MPKKKGTAGAGSIRKKTIRKQNGQIYYRWEARYTVGFDPLTGKQIQKSITGDTQREVAQKLRQYTAELDQGITIIPSRLTTAEWLHIWVDQYLGNVKPRTLALYKNCVKLYLEPTLGSKKLDKLQSSDIQSVYTAFQNREKPLSPKTIKNIHGVLHKALQKAVELGYIRKNPSDPCVLPRIEKASIQPLDADQIKALLKAMRGHRFENLYFVDLFIGMREGELLGLKWDCVDFDKGTIFIRQQLQRDPNVWGGFMFTSLKNGKTRKITPAPFVMEALQRQRNLQEEQRRAAMELWEDTGLVFTNEVGQNLSPLTVYKNFKRLAEEIGCPNARFHDLRHSYAVAAIQSGDDIKTVQENLGHHTAAFTLDVYGHVTDQMRQDSATRMQGFIDSVSDE